MLKIKTLLPLCKFFVTQHFDYDKKVTIFQEAKTCDNVREHLEIPIAGKHINLVCQKVTLECHHLIHISCYSLICNNNKNRAVDRK